MKGRVNTAVGSRFAGWPKPALQFFHGLKRDNSKAYFEAHRQVYEEQVRQPMEALLAELEKDLGPDIEVKIFRLNRDLRFSPDKRPYKEHLGAYLSTPGAGGLYLQVSNDGLSLAMDGYQVTEPSFKRVPAGYPADHPRGDLLRCKGLMASRNWKPGAWLSTVEAKDRVRQAIKDSKPLTSWLDTQVGPSREPARPMR